jgi:hypothetical protein
MCGKCLPPSLDDVSQGKKWKEGYQCHLGLYNFCIPVTTVNNQAAAYMLVGPVFLGRRRKEQGYKQKAAQLGLDQERFIDAIIEVKAFTFTGILSVIELISDIACYVVQLGYSRFKLERLIPVPKIGKLMHRFYIERILNALLDVSFNTAGGEFGSIMLLNEETGELYIKIAKGIKKDIIKNTRLRIGEGIAGLALKEKRLFLLDDRVTDERIKARLRRPEIKSAIVAPFHLKNEPLGVMNIGTTKSTRRITSENIETLQRLIELTETSLADLAKM